MFNEYDKIFIQPSDAAVLSDFADALAPLDDFVRIIEGQQYATNALVAPLLKSVQRALEDDVHDTRAAQRFKAIIRRHLKKRLSFVTDTLNLASCASALHPCFATLHFLDDAEVREGIWKVLEETAIDFEGGYDGGSASLSFCCRLIPLKMTRT